MKTLQITREAVLKTIEEHPETKEIFETLFPEVKKLEFYCGATFRDKKNNQFLVVHSPQYDRQYYLVDIKTGYVVRGLTFIRANNDYKLSYIDGELDNYILEYEGNRK